MNQYIHYDMIGYASLIYAISIDNTNTLDNIWEIIELKFAKWKVGDRFSQENWSECSSDWGDWVLNY